MSKNTDKPLRVSNCHRAAIEFRDGKLFCSVCRQRCTSVEHLVEEAVESNEG